MEKVRDWLRTASGRTTIPGYQIINTGYREFRAKLPTLVHQFGFSVNNLPFVDYRAIVEETVDQQLQRESKTLKRTN